MTSTRRALGLVLVVAVGAVLLTSCLPRMKHQPSIRPFEQQMPDMPSGTVPVGGANELPSADAVNPLETTDEVSESGALYYGYYCAMCHGDDGGGRTPVGEAYDPMPTDLTALDMTDGELLRKMLTGVGHDPVMQSTVPPERRWPIVAHVRTLARAATDVPE